MSLILRATATTDLGLGRGNNEDAAYAGDRVLAVADGMGGLPAGELASELVIRVLADLDGAPEPADPVGTLTAAFAEANGRILATAQGDTAAREGMGTTGTALLFTGDRAGLVHVGDSRCYLLRDGTLTRLTRDDTYVQELVDRGVISPEEARGHPQRSVVTKAMQGDPVEPTGAEFEVRAGDRFLLCSDGLSDVVTDESIAQALASVGDLDQCADALVKLALGAGAPDNVTVVLGDLQPA